MTDTPEGARDDWRAEAGGLAYMIRTIHDRYVEAKRDMGGDSELLASAIVNANRYVRGPLAERYAAGAPEPPTTNPGPERGPE